MNRSLSQTILACLMQITIRMTGANQLFLNTFMVKSKVKWLPGRS